MTRILSALKITVTVNIIAFISISAALGSAYLDSGQEKDFVELKYAPDRKVDILHVRIEVTPDFNGCTIDGVTTITFAPIAKPLSELRLDAYDLLVSSVQSTANISGYNVTDEDITITFEPAIEPGIQTSVTITYKAEPREGLYFRTPKLGYKAEEMHLFSQGESHSHRWWFPNYDYPNERSTSEVICHVPMEMIVLSNGRLVSEVIDDSTGIKTVCWRQEKPHVNYLIALVAGKFEKIESKHKDIPLAFYTTPSNIKYAVNSFKNTAEIMDFFEKEIGIDYPWDKYYQVCVKDFVAGGMENTTLTILADRTLFTEESENIRSSDGLVAHEMAHQWFGDYVTCKDWGHLWINEGFATYYGMLYGGYKNGRDELLYSLYNTAQRILMRTDEQRPIVYRAYDDAGEQFDYRNYGKGGWVLHMLRCRLGDELYRECVRTFLSRYALSSVITEDFVSIVEELSGRSYDRFFDQWVRFGRFPELDISYEWLGKEKLAKVSITQTQEAVNKVHIYYFPVKIRFVVNGQIIDKEVNVNSREHDFYFPLPAKPEIARFDPECTLLAKVKFKTPREMLYAQLEDTNDVIGRILAIEQLEKNTDKTTVEKLKLALNNDCFYGVRIKAAEALSNIKNDEAFEALKESVEQADARVRLEVLSDIGSIYRPESHEIMLKALEDEKNPEIVAAYIRRLPLYRDAQTKQILSKYTKSDSFRNRLAETAIGAIRKMDDPCFIPELMETIETRQEQFSAGIIAGALGSLAYISREEEDKTEIREFITEYVNHKNRRVKTAALRALGTLGDVRATALLESFASEDDLRYSVPRRRIDTNFARAARAALEKLNKERKFAPDEVIELREKVDELKKETDKIKDELDDLKNKFSAIQAAEPNDTTVDDAVDANEAVDND